MVLIILFFYFMKYTGNDNVSNNQEIKPSNNSTSNNQNINSELQESHPLADDVVYEYSYTYEYKYTYTYNNLEEESLNDETSKIDNNSSSSNK